MQCQRCYSFSPHPGALFCTQCGGALRTPNAPIQGALPQTQPGYQAQPYDHDQPFPSQPQASTVPLQPPVGYENYSTTAPPQAGCQNVNGPPVSEAGFAKYSASKTHQLAYQNNSLLVGPEAQHEKVGASSAFIAPRPSASTAETQQELLNLKADQSLENVGNDLKERVEKSTTEALLKKGTGEQQFSSPYGAEPKPYPKSNSQTLQSDQPPPQKDCQTHQRKEVEHKKRKVSEDAFPRVGVNPPETNYRNALSSKTTNPSEPEMPAVPCGPRNQNVWPEDHWPSDKHTLGFIRQKVFPNCKCTICKYPHPSKLHYTAIDMFEAWRERSSGPGLCENCHKWGHTVAECGLGEWRDLPDNPPIDDKLSAQYSQYLRPWPPRTNRTPFPIYYYMPKRSKGSAAWPDLPPPYSKTGIQAGLVDVHYGIRYSLELFLWKNNRGPKPNYDPAKHRPYFWSPNGGARPGEGRSPLKEDARVTPRDSEKTAQPPTKPSVEAGKQTSLNAFDDGFRGVDHHPLMPNPGYDDKLRTWFNEAFMAAILPNLIKEDDQFLSRVHRQFKEARVNYEKRENATELKTMLNLLAQGWEILAPYIPAWWPGTWRMPISLHQKLLDRAKKRQQAVDERQSAKPVGQPPKDPSALERSVGELQDPYLPVLVEDDRKIDVRTLDYSKTTSEQRKHPGLRPKGREEAQAHITHCVQFHEINMSSWKKASRYTQWFLEAWKHIEMNTYLVFRMVNRVDVLDGRLSKSESDTRLESQRKIINDLGGRLLRRTMVLVQNLGKECESLKQRKHTMEEFDQLEARLIDRWDNFNRHVTIDINKAFNGLSQQGVQMYEALKAWLDEDDFYPTWKNATGGLLPQRSSEECVLPLWLWPAAFQEAWIHDFHMG
ncbi:uncharacterized protein Z520_11348 [Fonsecaea multimorphosa CBS 102226]|uniref:Uncharacterized protein n=1 Tax=Fonsecaea multimorphosa CBS 102226 TaxID=1442371 RepID=A0A0D2JI87_9EURO|nr:uncharacterized protein Z520_11348 [Fonsecaea multimorphosa CBS 102226]KIX92872.1 hypothetical protein Z520_11348 [Fonsecaea multimorphosa CBS 102226]